jgi:PHB_DH: 3-hydroxybutyrate dehydrogenase
LQGRNSVGK